MKQKMTNEEIRDMYCKIHAEMCNIARIPTAKRTYAQKRDYKILCEKLDLIEKMFDIWG